MNENVNDNVNDNAITVGEHGHNNNNEVSTWKKNK